MHVFTFWVKNKDPVKLDKDQYKET